VLKTLKISLVATLATILAWRVHVPQTMWPRHPQLALVLFSLIVCLVLQLVWAESGPTDKTAGQVGKPQDFESKAKWPPSDELRK